MIRASREDVVAISGPLRLRPACRLTDANVPFGTVISSDFSVRRRIIHGADGRAYHEMRKLIEHRRQIEFGMVADRECQKFCV